MKKNKVAIVGYTPHRSQAPYNDESFEIWGLNDLYTCEDVKRWDRWFQIHHPDHYASNRTSVSERYAEYARWGCPVYLWQPVQGVPNSVQFPYKELTEKYGGYFNNTVSWMIAFALHEGFEEIHIYGVDMAVHSEYGHQRPSCEYFIGLARGMGIKVVLPEESELLQTKYLYGLESDKEGAEKKDLLGRKGNVTKQMTEAEQVVKNANARINACQGAIAVLDELIAKL